MRLYEVTLHVSQPRSVASPEQVPEVHRLLRTPERSPRTGSQRHPAKSRRGTVKELSPADPAYGLTPDGDVPSFHSLPLSSERSPYLRRMLTSATIPVNRFSHRIRWHRVRPKASGGPLSPL